jgi:hypothetical protein
VTHGHATRESFINCDLQLEAFKASILDEMMVLFINVRSQVTIDKEKQPCSIITLTHADIQLNKQTGTLHLDQSLLITDEA